MLRKIAHAALAAGLFLSPVAAVAGGWHGDDGDRHSYPGWNGSEWGGYQGGEWSGHGAWHGGYGWRGAGYSARPWGWQGGHGGACWRWWYGRWVWAC